ncbi:hypothetical protein VNO77_22121 [Canavalia gladiata]|uniref:Uncharacterized protein n=1 Tax=Canavalia gladiata TaxID=3824 RepID=A0AAN9L4K7_CANGL
MLIFLASPFCGSRLSAIATVQLRYIQKHDKVFEDNVLVKELVERKGEGRVLVVPCWEGIGAIGTKNGMGWGWSQWLH